MPLSEIGKPFQGVIYYAVEDSFASLPHSAVTDNEWLPVSKYVQNVRVGTGDKHAPIRGFDSPILKELLTKTNEPELHVEYNPQCDDTLLAHCANRGSCCTLESFTFVVGISTCVTGDADNNSYYVLDGCKAGTVRIASAHDEPYTITIDFLAKSLTPYTGSEATDYIDSVPTELDGDVLQFNVAGSILKSGGDYQVEKDGVDRLAYITNSVDVTIEHQLTSYSDHDSLDRDFIVEGTIDVSGTVDITMDGGGSYHMDEVISQNDFIIVVDLGAIGCPRIELLSCQWDTGEVTGDISGEAVMSSCPFTAIPTGCSDDEPGLTIVSSKPTAGDDKYIVGV